MAAIGNKVGDQENLNEKLNFLDNFFTIRVVDKYSQISDQVQTVNTFVCHLTDLAFSLRSCYRQYLFQHRELFEIMTPILGEIRAQRETPKSLENEQYNDNLQIALAPALDFLSTIQTVDLDKEMAGFSERKKELDELVSNVCKIVESVIETEPFL